MVVSGLEMVAVLSVVYLVYRLVKGSAPPKWPTDEEARQEINRQRDNKNTKE